MSDDQPSPTGRVRSAVDWLFRNRETGEITVAQFPNLPLWIFLGTVVLRWLVPEDSGAFTGLRVVALAALVHWNNLDPIRVFLVNVVGLFFGWIALQAILQIREGKKGAIGKGVSSLLAGICVTDAVVVSFCVPALILPMLCLYPFARWVQKKFAAT